MNLLLVLSPVYSRKLVLTFKALKWKKLEKSIVLKLLEFIILFMDKEQARLLRRLNRNNKNWISLMGCFCQLLALFNVLMKLIKLLILKLIKLKERFPCCYKANHNKTLSIFTFSDLQIFICKEFDNISFYTCGIYP